MNLKVTSTIIAYSSEVAGVSFRLYRLRIFEQREGLHYLKGHSVAARIIAEGSKISLSLHPREIMSGVISKGELVVSLAREIRSSVEIFW